MFAVGVALVTSAYFSDEEKSEGNTFQAGAIDLKVDHTLASYNEFDCHTCKVTLISDTSNQIVAKDGVSITPFNAVLAWTHPAWTAEEDPILTAAGAQWIWATNPTSTADAQNGVIYKFQKKFNWQGPAMSSDLWFAVGSDNSVEVWLNGTKIGENLGEFGYKKESMLHIPSGTVLSYLVQGQNTLEFVINNFARPGQDGYSNPGGLVYKFEIDGKCTDNYFLTNCRLWDTKNLEAGDIIYKFDDLKPGDRGRDVISLKVEDNDAWICSNITGTDDENVRIEPEKPEDTSDDVGELSSHIQVFAWYDDNDGIFEPGSGETQAYQGLLGPSIAIPVAQPPTPMPALTTKYLGIAWCFGTQTVDLGTGAITCSGVGETNVTQTDIYTATVNFYAEQARNNPDFSCTLEK